MAVYVPNPASPLGSPADLVENLGAEIAARFAEAEELMIERVAKLTAKGGDTIAAAERVRVLGELRQQGARIAGQLADREFVAQIVAIAAADGEAAAIARLGLTGRIDTTSGITGASANAVGQVALDLSSRLEDMSARITRWMPDAYRHVISMTTTGVLVGAETLLESQRRASERFLAMGVTGFEDVAGRQWRIGTYAEMASRTAIGRAWQDAHIAAAQQYAGVNLVTIVGGSNMCAKCAPHVGRIYSTDGTPGGIRIVEHSTEDRSVPVDVVGDLSVARAAGWGHPNCRCVVVAYMPGLSIPKGSAYDPQAEKNRDRLRELERDVRDAKRRLAASQGDDLESARWRRKIRERQGKIRDHVAETGMRRRNYREQLHFSDGGPRPDRSRWAPPRPVVPPTAPHAPRTRPNAGGPSLPPAPTPPVVPRPAPRPAPVVAAPPAPSPFAPFGGAVGETDMERLVRQAREELDALTATRDAARAAFPNRSTAVVEELRATTTTAAARAVLRRELEPLGVRLEGMTDDLELEAIRGAGVALSRMLGKYPRVNLVKFEAGKLDGERTLAEAVAQRVFGDGGNKGASRITAQEIRVQATRARTSSTVTQVRKDTHAGHFHHVPEGREWEYLVTHEFGHVLDFAGQQRLIYEIPDLERTYFRTTRDNSLGTSGYGATHPSEKIAEAFADVELNGENAAGLSKAIHARLLELYDEETR